MASKIIILIPVILIGFILGTGAYVGFNMYYNPTRQSTEIVQPDLYSGVLIVETDNGQGSCFVVAQREDYWYAITAGHVVKAPTYPYVQPEFEDGPSIAVDDEEYAVEIVQIDSDEDVALIRFKSPEKYRIYLFSTVDVGESCIAAGWSRETFLRYPGSVVALDFKNFIVANGGVVPGCSGGPLLDKDGNVIGITAQIAVYRGQMFDSMALYVPARYAVALLIGSGVREF